MRLAGRKRGRVSLEGKSVKSRHSTACCNPGNDRESQNARESGCWSPRDEEVQVCTPDTSNPLPTKQGIFYLASA
jgi:hypothetical protein